MILCWLLILFHFHFVFDFFILCSFPMSKKVNGEADNWIMCSLFCASLKLCYALWDVVKRGGGGGLGS